MLLETMTAAEAMQQGEAQAQPDWMQLHIAAEVAAIDAVPEPKAQPLDVSRFNVPAWARWIAADSDGFVFPYEVLPRAGRDCWNNTGDRQVTCIATIDMTGIDWRRTLTPMNQEQPVLYTATSKDWLQKAESPKVVIADDETARKIMDQVMTEYDEAWTRLAEYDEGESQPRPTTINIAHHHTYPLIHCDCGMGFVLLGYVSDTVFEQGMSPFCPYCGKGLDPTQEQHPAQPWCERCNLPEDICRGHEEPVQCDRGDAALAAAEAAGSVLKGFFGGGTSEVMQRAAAPSPTIETIVTLWQQLDGMQECELAAAMVRVSARAADGFFTTLGMALEAVQSPQYNSDADMAPANVEQAAPVAGKDHPSADTPTWHRCNFEQRDTGIVFCDGDHERSEPCMWQPLTVQQVEAMAKQPAAQEVPAAQVSIAADAIPGDVAEALFANHSAEWCERLREELAALQTAPSADVTLFVTQLQAMTADQLTALARQLAQADAGKANLFAEALWGNGAPEDSPLQGWDRVNAELRMER